MGQAWRRNWHGDNWWCGDRRGVGDGTRISGGPIGTRDGSTLSSRRNEPAGPQERVDGVLEPSKAPSVEPSGPIAIPHQSAVLVNDGSNVESWLFLED